MASRSTIAGDIVKEYCDKYAGTDIKDLTLAKRIYADRPEAFKNLEDVRSKVRYYVGHSGDYQRKYCKDKHRHKPLTFDTSNPHLPKSQNVPINIFTLPTSIKKVLFLSDIHLPYHDEQAIETAIQYGLNENVDCIYVNGDLMDFYQISFHEKDPGKMDLFGEIEQGKVFFKYLRHKFPLAVIYYIPGNHEYRLERYISQNAAALKRFNETNVNVLLKLHEYDVIFIPHGSKVYFGKLLVEHGDKLRGTGGVNPARTLGLKLKRHAISGHWHRTSEAISKVYDGDSFVTYSVGCLCDLEPAYLPVNEHNHGAAIIEMLGGGEFVVHNKKISNGRVY